MKVSFFVYQLAKELEYVTEGQGGSDIFLFVLVPCKRNMPMHTFFNLEFTKILAMELQILFLLKMCANYTFSRKNLVFALI